MSPSNLLALIYCQFTFHKNPIYFSKNLLSKTQTDNLSPLSCRAKFNEVEKV